MKLVSVCESIGRERALRLWWVCVLHFTVLIVFLCYFHRHPTDILVVFHSDWLRNRTSCVHIHVTDPSVAMQRVVRFLLFVLCSVWPLAENCSELKAIHTISQHASRCGKSETRRTQHSIGPIALGFKCVNFSNEFDSWSPASGGMTVRGLACTQFPRNCVPKTINTF